MKTDADDIEESDVFADEFVVTSYQRDSFEKLRRREGVDYICVAIIDEIEGAKRMSSVEDYREMCIG